MALADFIYLEISRHLAHICLGDDVKLAVHDNICLTE
jgi:hypothetical protein